MTGTAPTETRDAVWLSSSEVESHIQDSRPLSSRKTKHAGMTGDHDALAAASCNARAVLRQVALLRGKIGPIATAAQQAAWQISAASGEPK
ncbi:hypothetical protein [Gluconacetobacter asukensis]|uniref:Uncharacterized protein n=1 Tax=Gluconacetobacter asukensis TaxID=1017181 RepID=A0A7W4IZ35_9PROT|nr:hypothetical protein [Gluconacetobacter asukensis]MBB2171661.1 hypothetical protein [Gluconacetobacter asukensis]